MGEGETFSVEQAMAAQKALRASLGLPEERFPLPAFVGMLSDEIELLRAAGRTDAEIAAAITAAAGRPVDPLSLARFYAPPAARRRPG